MKRILAVAFVLASSLALSGSPGPFTASVTGATTESVRGEAIFQSVYLTGDSLPSLWWITLTAAGNADHRIQFSRARVGIPAVGSYTIADSRRQVRPDPDQFDAKYEHRPTGDAANFSGRGGTLEILTSTPTRITGRFNFRADGDDGDSTRFVNVTGRFTADRAADRRK